MAIGPVITVGFGSFGNVNLLPTIGYALGVAPAAASAAAYHEMIGASAEYVDLLGGVQSTIMAGAAADSDTMEGTS